MRFVVVLTAFSSTGCLLSKNVFCFGVNLRADSRSVLYVLCVLKINTNNSYLNTRKTHRPFLSCLNGGFNCYYFKIIYSNCTLNPRIAFQGHTELDSNWGEGGGGTIPEISEI